LKQLAAWVHERVPGDADLDRPALSQLVRELAGEPRFWQRFVKHDPETRYFSQLYRDPHLDLWLICWLDAQDTGYHDHDVSSGAVYVCEGILAEDRFRFDGDIVREATREHEAGATFDFDAAYIHRMRHARGGPATSIHVYSPALWRMGYYERDANDNLCRTSITYADEVGPLPYGR
jgi:predicted metal-dependent enzyme (double-stranded beta helix superfamily)